MNDHIEFQVCRSNNPLQPYFWHIVSKGNVKILAASETMVNKADCIAAIRLVKANAATATIFDLTGPTQVIIEP